MQAVIERHVTAGPDLQYKLEQSRKLAESQELRTIRCPSCGFYMLDVYGHEHYLIRVKCRKCKLTKQSTGAVQDHGQDSEAYQKGPSDHWDLIMERTYIALTQSYYVCNGPWGLDR
jgi:phage FluMu protein Com